MRRQYKPLCNSTKHQILTVSAHMGWRAPSMLSLRRSDDIGWAHSLAGTAAGGCDLPQFANSVWLLRWGRPNAESASRLHASVAITEGT